MTERAFAAELAGILNGEIDYDETFDGNGVRYVVSYDEAWISTHNAGVVVRLDDGSEFRVTVVRSRGPRS